MAPFYGVVTPFQRPLRVLDLIPTGSMEGTVVPYVVETGDFDADVAETRELAIKPADSVTLTDAEARARTIANWAKVPRQILADVAGLAQTITDRLTYKVLRRLETQAINGDGTGSNLTGILPSTGIGTEVYVSGRPLADAVLVGIRDVILSGVEPDAIVINPADWAAQLTQKASGSGEYISVDGPFGQPPTSLWGTPLVVSAAIPAGKALVGSFAVAPAFSSGTRKRDPRNGERRPDPQPRNVARRDAAAVAVLQPSAFCVVHLAQDLSGRSSASEDASFLVLHSRERSTGRLRAA